jgi:membrane fusion protein (multidrug efflux system)
VATEAENGLVRVELAVDPDPASRVPLQHGLTGIAVIDVERVTPATLVLRAAGQLFRPRRGGSLPPGREGGGE